MTNELSLEQQKALALASARKRKAEAEQQSAEQGSGLLDQLGERNERIEALQQQRRSGEITRPEEIYRSAGEGAGAVFDVAGAGMSLADKALFNLPSKSLSAALKVAGKLPTGFGGEGTLSESLPQEMQKIAGAYSEFKEENPRKAGLLEATGNLLSLGSAPVTKQAFKKPGKAIYDSGVKKSDDLIMKQIQKSNTPKVREAAQVEGRLKQRLLGADVVEPSDIEKRALGLVKDMPEFKNLKQKSFSAKEAAVRTKARDTSINLQKDLGQYNNFKFKPDRLKSDILSKIEADLLDDPTLWTTNNFKPTVNNFIKKAEQIIDSNPKTLQGLMKSRIEFDDWVKSKSPNVFNPGAETINRAATKATRNAINDFIDKAVPSQAVKERLRDSHALYSVADNMAEKVSKQAPTPLMRIIDKAEEKMPFQSEVTKAGALGGIGLLATQNPQAAAAIAALYAAQKATTSAGVKKAIGTALVQGADFFDLATKEALQDYMNQLEEQEEEALKSDVKTGKVFFEGQQ